MEQRQLEIFLAVAEELHFGKAAKRLHITEQPVGYQIKKLEAELGFALFDRTTRSVSLTPAGSAFARDARDLLFRAQRAASTASRIAAGRAGVIRLGYESSTAPAILSTFVQVFRTAYPEIDLILTECSARGLIPLEDGRIDACLITRYERLPQDIAYIPIIGDAPYVALPDDHPLAGRESVGIDELEGTALLGYAGDASEPANQFMQRLAAVHGLEFLQMAESHMALLSLVAAGMGFTASTGTMSKFVAGEVSYARIARPSISLDHGLALPQEGQVPAAEALKLTAIHVTRTLYAR